jgi:DNA-binding transcriptional MocR family regulator
LFLLLAVGGCSTTRTVEVEVFQPLPAQPLKKIRVVALHENGRVRRIFENTLVAELTAHGVEGIASHRFIYQESAINVRSVQRAIAESNADGVITARVLDADLKNRPARVQMGAPAADVYDLQSAPPEQVENLMPRKPSSVVIQTNTYAAAGTTLLLTANSRAIRPESVEEVSREVSQETIRSLAREKVLPR